MKQVKVTGVRKAEVIDVPTPKPKENWVLVKVYSAPMCTEFKGFISGDGKQGYGHEAAGEVIETAQPCRVKVGDRVVVQPGTPCGKCELCVSGEFIHCQNWYSFEKFTGGNTGLFTMAQYVLKQDWLLSPIPDDVSYDIASMTICALGPTFGAFEMMKVDAFDTILITGLGPVGLGGIVNAKYRGAMVIGIESHPYRTKLAKELGAEEVISPSDPDALKKVMEFTKGRGIDKAVDCSGAPAAHTFCLEAACRKGHIAFVGQCHEPSNFIVSKHMIQKGLTLHGAWHYNLAVYPRVLEVAKRSPVIKKLITHTFPIGKIQEAWELQCSGNCGKIILKPWE